MSRRHRAQKREVLPDPKFGDLIVTKFMNYVMYEGKKAVAENIVYGAFDILAEKKKDHTAVETFHTALDNVAPSVEVRSRRVGSTLPTTVATPSRSVKTPTRWPKPTAPSATTAGKRLQSAIRRAYLRLSSAGGLS